MSYLIYTSLEASNGLIPQPGRAVNTFPSGLVRVDQTYLGLTANAATHRAILAVGNDMPDGDTAPCIDGLKIFPEVQERRREDGFTEYIVSAYGRTKTTPTIEPRVVSLQRFNTLTLFRKTVTATIVSQNQPSLSELNLSQNLFELSAALLFIEADINEDTVGNEAVITVKKSGSFFTTYTLNFGFTQREVVTALPGIKTRSDKVFPLPLTLSQRNFGFWTEWIFAYG
jgi:hypothetical protein